MSGSAQSAEVLGQLQRLYHVGPVGNLSDGLLLERFLNGTEDAAHAAFAALVDRHGPMVAHVCRNVLGDAHDAEDAFQATFLVLARKARSVRQSGSVGGYLHGVAQRVSLKARTSMARRRVHERTHAELRALAEEATPSSPGDAWPELHEEIDRLPSPYREAVVLCYLQGLSTEVAAARIGCPQGTVLSRLARARQRLRDRLHRRGVAVASVSAVAAGTIAPVATAGTLPPSLVASTTAAALQFTGTTTTTAVATTAAAALAQGVIQSMNLSRLKLISAATAGLLTLSALPAAAYQFGGASGSGEGSPRSPQVKSELFARQKKNQEAIEQPQATQLEDQRNSRLDAIERVQAQLRGLRKFEADLIKDLEEFDRRNQKASAPGGPPPAPLAGGPGVPDAPARDPLLGQMAGQLTQTQNSVNMLAKQLADLSVELQKLREERRPVGASKGQADPFGTGAASSSTNPLSSNLDSATTPGFPVNIAPRQKPATSLSAPSSLPALGTTPRLPGGENRPLDPFAQPGPPDPKPSTPMMPGMMGPGMGEAPPVMGGPMFPPGDGRPTLYRFNTCVLAISPNGGQVRSVDLATGKDQRLDLGAADNDPLKITPISTGGSMIALAIQGKTIHKLAVWRRRAADTQEPGWATLDLEEPLSGNVAPILGSSIVAYKVGDRLFAYGLQCNRWDSIKVAGAAAGGGLTVSNSEASLQAGGHLYVFVDESPRVGRGGMGGGGMMGGAMAPEMSSAMMMGEAPPPDGHSRSRWVHIDANTLLSTDVKDDPKETTPPKRLEKPKR
ncbi:MAG: sigma-70 family RNA polymerase sigma factor [Isosphaeraceae bacterium]